jgi:hypothetical protein
MKCLQILVAFVTALGLAMPLWAAELPLQAGFAEADITPKLGAKPVYVAGFGHNRKATGVLDPLLARAVVLKHGKSKLAIVSIDVVGLFHPQVMEVRKELAGFTYVLVTSTHNHEGPDTLGIWGPNFFQSGVDSDYRKTLLKQIVKAVNDADTAARPVSARIGAARAPELLHDGREPYIKHDELVALQFFDARTNKPAGLVVQWNCHPETLGGKNTKISSDFVGATVGYLQAKYKTPVVYLTGTVGGLMTSLHVEVKDERGKLLEDGTVQKTHRYGKLVGQLADRALSSSKPIGLTPLEIRSRPVFLPLANRLYLAGWQLGVLERQAFVWTGDPSHARPLETKKIAKQQLCIRTEVGWLRLGDLEVACIPGEIYPELVLDKVQDPADPAADFPSAPIEPAVYKQLKAPHRMLIGLANDEIGYIIPKRQWDEKPPFCYKRDKKQYGEENSLGPDTAPLLCRAFQELVEGKKSSSGK